MTMPNPDSIAADIAELYAYPDKGRRVVDIDEVRAAVNEYTRDPDTTGEPTIARVRQILRARGYTIRVVS